MSELLDAIDFPPRFRAHLERAIAIERADGRDAEADALVAHYAVTMPAMRDAQRAHPLFRAPLAWDAMPRLTRALDRLAALLAEADLAWRPPRDAPTLGALFGAAHYGGCMPMLYGYPADLDYIAAHGGDLDRLLVAPIVHELCHLDRARASALPLHLDECIGGYLGVLVHPELAYPAPGDAPNDAIYAAPWLAQVGQAIVRAFGLRATLRAHAGVEPLPAAFVAAATALADADWRARRSTHLLADTFAPEPWLALLPPLAPDPDADRAIVEDALRAMCLATELVDGSFRTRIDLGVPRTVEIDPIARAVRGGEARYWLPPSVARARTLTIAALADIPSLARACCEDAAPG